MFSQPLRLPAPGKLNLFLYINGRRADGYHELQTLFQFIDFHDWLTIEATAQPQITLKGVSSSLFQEHIAPEDNLIFKAATLLQRATGCAYGANIQIEKNLPMGAGLGGGSSDAATTLVGLNQLWQTGLSLVELAQLGLQLGADVPIFIQGRAAFAEGVGEQLQFCTPPEKYYLVLWPNVAIATASIFADPDLPRNTPKQPLMALLSQPFRNDCEKVVINHYSEVEYWLDWLLKYAPARLTGTGSCLFAEFDDLSVAQAVVAKKPMQVFGFVTKGCNVSSLHRKLNKQL